MLEHQESRLPSPRELKAQIDAERKGQPFVLWRDGAGAQHIMLLSPDRPRATIGRREQSDIALTWDQEVSRTHALLEPVGEEWTLIDDGLSRNGSYVNGSRIRGRHRLADRETMVFGRTRVVYREPNSADESQSTVRPRGSQGAIPLSETQRRVLIALCRPILESGAEMAATNPAIASEVSLSVDAVKGHLRALFARFDLDELPQNEKRLRLATIVLTSGLLVAHDF
jgi:FHA domain-containing protein